MNWVKKSLKKMILLKCKFHGWCNFPGQLTARSQPRQGGKGFQLPDEEFNFWLPVYYSSTTLRATAASLDLCTPPLSAQKIRRVGGGLLSQCTPLKRPQATLTSTTPRTAATLTMATLRIVTLPTATRTVSTSMLTPRGRSLLYRQHFEEDHHFIADDQARGDLEAGQEGHHKRLDKAGGAVDLNVVPPPEPTQVPPLPILPLAGLA